MAVGIQARANTNGAPLVESGAVKTAPRVLVVDDDPSLQLLARAALEQNGFAVEEATDGAAALDTFSRLHPDIVLLDVNLPKADGFTVCSRIRRLPRGSNTPVMIMTGTDDVDAIHTAYEVGATDFITKPLHWVLLGYRLRYVLRASRIREDLAVSTAAHAHTEQILASISWILIAGDEDDTITQWNQAAEATFGIPASAVVGRPLADAGIDWNWDWMFERIEEARRKDHPTRLDEIRYRRADGKERFLGVTLNPIKAAPGQRAGFLLLGSDITERKVLETQLAQAQRLEAIGRLAAGVAHEINTPIQFVGDNTRFLQTAFDDLHPLVSSYRTLRDAVKAGAVTPAGLVELEEVEQDTDVDYLVTEIPKAVSQTLDGITRVATIVQALKEFAHPGPKEMVATDLNQALLSTLSVARNEIKYVADVETDFGDVPFVVCQPGDLNQVFLNVIVNAAHAIADAVQDSGGRGVIRVRTAREDDMALIAISDTGTGIAEEHRERLFDPFFTTKEVGRGTGQGLAIAHSVVVDKHGGSLTFETEIGRGTTFFIRLPIAGTDGKAEP